MSDNEDARLRDFTNLSIFSACALAAMAVVAFYKLGKLGMGEIASLSVFCIYLVVFATWPMKDQKWYWPFILSFLLIHVFAIALLGEISSFPFMALLPFAAIDVFGTIYLMSKFDAKGRV